MAVPVVFVMLPDVGVVPVGRTRRPLNVMTHGAVLDDVEIVTVAEPAATESPLMTQSPVFPTEPNKVLNSKPPGRVSTIVPVENVPNVLPSSITGPVRVV